MVLQPNLQTYLIQLQMANLDQAALDKTIQFCVEQKVLSRDHIDELRGKICLLIQHCGPYDFSSFDARKLAQDRFAIIGYDPEKQTRVITKCRATKTGKIEGTEIKLKRPEDF